MGGGSLRTQSQKKGLVPQGFLLQLLKLQGWAPERKCVAQQGRVLHHQAQPSALSWQGQGPQGRRAPGAQPAQSNLIEQETGLQPDKASTQHLELLFPYPCCRLSQAPAAGPQEHLGQEGAPTGSGSPATGRGPTGGPEGGLVEQ